MTTKLQANSFPVLSSAEQVTFVFPMGNSDPDGGVHRVARSPPVVSIADGFFHTTIAVDLPGSVDSIGLTEHTGSSALEMGE